jgi:membrane protein
MAAKTKKKSLSERFTKLYHFFVVDIWHITETELSKTTRFFLRLLKKLILSGRGFLDHNLSAKAGSLTYYTLMAVVPICALVIAIGKGFGFQHVIENWAANIFTSQKELIPYVIQFVNNYLEQAQGGVFLGIGIAVLLWSVMSAFRQIESNFNNIWNVKKSRSIIRQFTTYFSLMLLTPILIVLSSGISIFFNNQLKELGFAEHFSFLYEFIMRLTPYFLYWVLFTFIFVVIPNTKVQFKHALFAGIVVGTAFQFFQWLYVNGQINLTKYNAVYGSFAAIPLLLFWLQISWLIVLYGAELTFASQNIDNYNFEKETAKISRRYCDYATIIIMRSIILKFQKGEPPMNALEIASENHTPIRLVNQILDLLVDIKVVAEIYTPGEVVKTYQPALDINAITVQLLLEKIEKHGSENFKIDHYSKEFEAIWKNLQEWKEKSISPYSILIKDL